MTRITPRPAPQTQQGVSFSTLAPPVSTHARRVSWTPTTLECLDMKGNCPECTTHQVHGFKFTGSQQKALSGLSHRACQVPYVVGELVRSGVNYTQQLWEKYQQLRAQASTAPPAQALFSKPSGFKRPALPTVADETLNPFMAVSKQEAKRKP
jgi:hypothetical protein